ncbi:MAG: GNAT family N-acetyltransferase [Anaeroplasmataceae bacterium]|nr:GNAT family N-acetyltransferase [Anaeroplasmataceae bacterium]
MIEIRKYQNQDYEKVRRICMSTAKRSYQNNEIICWLFLDYYLESEHQHAFVAVEQEEVIGYIVVSTDALEYENQMKEKWIPKIQEKSLFLSLFARICVQTNKKFNKNGCEFHMNIAPSYQHKGLGHRLLDVMAQHLLLYDKKYLYCITENNRTKGYRFYRHYGFKVIKRYCIGVLALQYALKK